MGKPKKVEHIHLLDDEGKYTEEGGKVFKGLQKRVSKYLNTLLGGEALGKPVVRSHLLTLVLNCFHEQAYNASLRLEFGVPLKQRKRRPKKDS